MKNNITYLIVLLLLCVGQVNAQKYATKSGVIDFEASVPSFEEVKAKNSSVSAILNTATGEFASLALIQGFRFKVALMEEHFNENYMESAQYPKAIVKGSITDFDAGRLSDTTTEFNFKGTIAIHGVTQPLETKVNLTKLGDQMEMSTSFILKPGDFDIKIPSIVSNKIADEVTVTAMYTLSQK
ncbi:YceI family protein [Aureisphaera galaxeae]|uniref:YceI family protein n=1 Tax=Aureisphaera galaxeae TaxID=1538023 RepID=UPI0023501A5B|nr:YceI family protein [Aureisphaera galaxeae]MDC8003646.1 YceI family protein [Aureisphaera galaxeae]